MKIRMANSVDPDETAYYLHRYPFWSAGLKMLKTHLKIRKWVYLPVRFVLTSQIYKLDM